MGININSLLRFPSYRGHGKSIPGVWERKFSYLSDINTRAMSYISGVISWSWIIVNDTIYANLKCFFYLQQRHEFLIATRRNFVVNVRTSLSICKYIKVWLVNGSFSIIETQFWFSIFFLWSLLWMAIWMYPRQTGWCFPAAEWQQWLMALQDLIQFPRNGFKSKACRRYWLL